MSTIKEITNYKYGLVRYDSLQAVKTAVENYLGATIDDFDITLTPKQKLRILQGLKDNRMSLVKLLTVTYSPDDNKHSMKIDPDKNILDYDE